MFWFIVIVVVIIVVIYMYKANEEKKSEEVRQYTIQQCTALKKLGAKCEFCDYPNKPKGRGTLQCAMASEEKHEYGVCTSYNGPIMPNKACSGCGSTNAMYFSSPLAECLNCKRTHSISYLV